MSNKPALYYALRSPPCRSVLLTSAALGVQLSLRQINIQDEDHMTPEFLKMNPLHTIPVLDDNGLIVSDSHLICGYLADKYAVNELLYPKEQKKRLQVDSLLYYDAGHLFARLRMLIEPVLYFNDDQLDNERINYVERAYDGLEKCLSTTPYLCGEHLTIADLCCVATVSTAALFVPIDETKYSKLKMWLERMKELPYYKKNNQEGVDMLYKRFQDKLIENKNKKKVTT